MSNHSIEKSPDLEDRRLELVAESDWALHYDHQKFFLSTHQWCNATNEMLTLYRHCAQLVDPRCFEAARIPDEKAVLMILRRLATTMDFDF